MAIMHPDWKTIANLHQRATEGELFLLHFLGNNLDDTYEIYFQANINGDRPDIVLMRKDSGVLIIEVKDWNLESYRNYGGDWHVIKDGKEYLKLSPFDQVSKYKENLYEMNIPSLLEKNIKNQKMFSVVGCALYFHKASKNQLNKILSYERKNRQYIQTFCKEELTSDFLLKQLIPKYYLNRKSQLFSQDLYEEFKRLLKPTFHTLDEGVDIKYLGEQRVLIKSDSVHQKIKGVPGSGKTLVLAKRAVNSHLRTNHKVLILCYNITLKNYIHDLVSKVRENFSWDYFEISNYHRFISSALNNLEITPKSLFMKFIQQNKKLNNLVENIGDFEEVLTRLTEIIGSEMVSDIWEKAIYSNKQIFSQGNSPENDSKYTIQRYDSILIDEVQDYKYEWLEILKNSFLSPNGEFVLFGDEKQNIYDRELDTKKLPKTNVLGRWNISLNKTYRIQMKIAKMVSDFQNVFLSQYNSDVIQTVEQFEMFGNNNLNIEYYDFLNSDYSIIAEIIIKYLKEKQIHSNDACLLGTSVSPLRQIDYSFRSQSREKTTTTFETEEILKYIFDQRKFKIIKNNSEQNSESTFLEGDLQIALRKVIKIIDFKETVELNETNDSTELISPKVDKLVEKITPQVEMEIERIRRNKKFNFWMNSGHFKISTIHSFKGWEIPNLFLLLDSSVDRFDKHELLYTALTRCKYNLVIISNGSNIYKEFFKKYVDRYEQI